MLYNNILETIDELPLNQQIQIFEILKQRIIQKKRNKIQENAGLAKRDYQEGYLVEETAEELISRLAGE
jgi:hypothetical protein